MSIPENWIALKYHKQHKVSRASTKAQRIFPRRLSENALLPKLFVMLKKIILGISTICLWLFFQAFLDFEQNCYSRTAS